MTAPEHENPNARPYMLTWNGTDVPYVSHDKRTVFTLAEAMRIAAHEPVTVTDGETGRVLWVGGRAMRGGL